MDQRSTLSRCYNVTGGVSHCCHLPDPSAESSKFNDYVKHAKSDKGDR
jgi:hypothetical protein